MVSKKVRRHLHGGDTVAVEPHPTTRRDGKTINVQSTPQWTRGAIKCGDCGRGLAFGHDGVYRHLR